MREVGTPTHGHDCKQCIFLGSTESHDSSIRRGIVYDLYFCLQGKGGKCPTVLARFGELGDYTSGLVFGTRGLIPVLEIAVCRALLAGHITVEQANRGTM